MTEKSWQVRVEGPDARQAIAELLTNAQYDALDVRITVEPAPNGFAPTMIGPVGPGDVVTVEPRATPKKKRTVTKAQRQHLSRAMKAYWDRRRGRK